MKKRIKNSICILLAVLTLAATALCVASAAKTSASDFADNSDVQAYQAAIKALEEDAAALKKRLQQAQNERYTAQQKANDLNNLILSTEKKIETTQSLLKALEAQIAAKEDEIAQKEAEIEAKAKEVAETRARFLALVQAQYESGSVSVLEVLLGSDSISDLLSRVEYMASLLDYNSKLLATFKREKQELEDMKSILEAAQNDLKADYAVQEEYSDSLEAEKEALQLQKNNADNYVASLKKSEAEILAEYNQSQKELEAENERLEKLLAELAAKSQKEYVGGKFIWPVDTSIRYISSYYGWRTYYYYGKKVTDFHTGIDIAAATGTDIYAVQDGEVIVSTSHWSYGNYIVVDHGGGITTLYAHCSKLLVKVGDTVKQGDHIAEMGMTGTATGPHVHFEVRVNGKHQDPLANGWVVQP